MNIVERSDDWLIVTLDKGLPVWVHKNFIVVKGRKGLVTGSNVNARSVPLISTGTVVGQLNKAETLKVLDQQDDWYRVQSPRRFKGWVKKAEYDTKPIIRERNDVVSQAPTREQRAPAQQATAQLPSTAPANGDQTDVNDWLFSQDEQSMTMQLASFEDPTETAQFANNKQFKDDPKLRSLTSVRNGTEWTYFLYGNYSSREEAETAKSELNHQRAWIRSFGRLQENRCLSWKQQIPAPKELNKYCIR